MNRFQALNYLRDRFEMSETSLIEAMLFEFIIVHSTRFETDDLIYFTEMLISVFNSQFELSNKLNEFDEFNKKISASQITSIYPKFPVPSEELD